MLPVNAFIKVAFYFFKFGLETALESKKSRARVTIGGQCVLLQNSLKIKLFDFFFKKPKLPYVSHLSRHTSEPIRKNVKILETRPQSSKNAPKRIKNG